jgi:hypothetical protein
MLWVMNKDTVASQATPRTTQRYLEYSLESSFPDIGAQYVVSSLHCQHRRFAIQHSHSASISALGLGDDKKEVNMPKSLSACEQGIIMTLNKVDDIAIIFIY